MKHLIIIAICLSSGVSVFGQGTIDHVLAEVEKNNSTLLAIRKSVDADKIANKTGLAPQNPEIEFNYLWGDPSAIGNRTDFSIRQSFDFPTAYSYKSQISDLKNQQAELEYRKQRSDILHQTRVACVKLTYYNALRAELVHRHTHAQKIADATKAKFNTGDVGILDYNKAQVNLLNIAKEIENIDIERNAPLAELAALNGGTAIAFIDSLFPAQTIATDFDQWYSQAEANNPLLQWVKQETAIATKQAKLNTAMSLPKLYGGFMSEKVVGQQFQGITVGISIPLWENNNTVKYANAKTVALQSLEADAKLQFYNSMKATHAKAVALQNSVADYRSKLALYSNSALLEKAFDKGEISLTEYMYELSLYYESIYNLLEMEKDLSAAFTELYKYQ
jgi:outer membrane protein, heavy metal efflux system